jgi:hypothetical protein
VEDKALSLGLDCGNMEDIEAYREVRNRMQSGEVKNCRGVDVERADVGEVWLEYLWMLAPWSSMRRFQ